MFQVFTELLIRYTDVGIIQQLHSAIAIVVADRPLFQCWAVTADWHCGFRYYWIVSPGDGSTAQSVLNILYKLLSAHPAETMFDFRYMVMAASSAHYSRPKVDNVLNGMHLTVVTRPVHWQTEANNGYHQGINYIGSPECRLESQGVHGVHCLVLSSVFFFLRWLSSDDSRTTARVRRGSLLAELLSPFIICCWTTA